MNGEMRYSFRTFLCYAVFFPLVIVTHPFVMFYEWATGTGGEYECRAKGR